MRRTVAAFAVLAAVALAGCSSEPHSPVDPEEAERGDYVVPLAIFLVAAAVGAVLLLAYVRSRRRKGLPRTEPTEEEPGEPSAEAGPPKPRRREP